MVDIAILCKRTAARSQWSLGIAVAVGGSYTVAISISHFVCDHSAWQGLFASLLLLLPLLLLLLGLIS